MKQAFIWVSGLSFIEKKNNNGYNFFGENQEYSRRELVNEKCILHVFLTLSEIKKNCLRT